MWRADRGGTALPTAFPGDGESSCVHPPLLVGVAQTAWESQENGVGGKVRQCRRHQEGDKGPKRQGDRLREQTRGRQRGDRRGHEHTGERR